MKKQNKCNPLVWEEPIKTRQCILKPEQKIVDFNIIFTGLPQDIDHVLNTLPQLPVDRNPDHVSIIEMSLYLSDELCQVNPSLKAYKPLEIRLYDLTGEESEIAVWHAIKQVYEQAAKENKIVFADPNFITVDPEGGSGGSGGVQGGPEGGSGGSGGVQGGPEGGSGGSGGVQGGPEGNVGGKSGDEAFMNHWAFYPGQGICLENGRGLRMSNQYKGEKARVYIFDTVDKRIDAEMDEAENYPKRSKAREHVKIPRGYPPEPLEICISSPAERFLGASRRVVQIESYRKIRVDEHGLFVAGLVHRVAPQSQIHLVDSLNQFGQGELFGFLQSLIMLAARGLSEARAKNSHPLDNTVINLSLGVILSEEVMEKEAVDLALKKMFVGINGAIAPQNPLLVSILDDMITDSQYVGSLRIILKLLFELGAVIVAAAGNDSAKIEGDLPSQIPARYPEVISVAASTRESLKANYSNRGDIMAPGGGRHDPDVKSNHAQYDSGSNKDQSANSVVSLVARERRDDSGYAVWQGTSFAAPLVSGLVALMIEKMRINHIKLSQKQIRNLIVNRARQGIVDVQMALDGIRDK